MALVKEIGPWAPSTFNVLRKQKHEHADDDDDHKIILPEEDAAEVHMYTYKWKRVTLLNLLNSTPPFPTVMNLSISLVVVQEKILS